MIDLYLSGGLKSNWQDFVIKRLSKSDFRIFNPNEHKLISASEYYTWDVYFIEKCDFILAYLEKTNPYGLGLVFEIGYGKALGKRIILIDEKSDTDEEYKRQFEFVCFAADLTFSKLDDAIDYLERYNINHQYPASTLPSRRSSK